MDFRRSGQRRRRTLLDDREGSSRGPQRRSSARTATPRPYTEDALAENQPRVTDLIPLWDLTLGAWFLAAAGCVAGLVALHGYAPEWGQWLRVPLDVFQLTGQGTLASWWSTLVLLAACGASLVIYQVRRFRSDDYRGSYIVWLWSAATWLAASLDVACDWRQTLTAALAQGPAWVVPEGATLVSLLLVALVYTALALRLVVEVWSCWPAVAWLALASLAYALAAAGSLALPEPLAALSEVPVRGGAALAGHALLLLHLAYYARYVYLDAQGEIPHAALAEEAPESTTDADDEADDDDQDEPATTNRPVFNESGAAAGATIRRSDLDPVPSGARRSVDRDDDDSGERKLSKAERKKLRKQGRAA